MDIYLLYLDSAIAEKCKQLEEINLAWCDIPEKSVLALGENCPNLKKIDLRWCYITDKAVIGLVTNKS